MRLGISLDLPHLGQRKGLPPWVLSGAAVDMDFMNNRVYGAPLFTDMLSCSRASAAYADNVDGSVTSFAANVLRRTNKGLLIEEARTNAVLWNRDLTNVAWVKLNITVLKDQIGADGIAASASKLTAGLANGTVLQTITLASSARFQSAYVKRITGVGVVQMTMDNGVTWTTITVTAAYQKINIPTQTVLNPIVGFRIVTAGDVIAVDFVQNENGAFGTSPIATTTVAVARAAEIVNVIGSALLLMQASAATAMVQSNPVTGILPTARLLANQANQSLLNLQSNTIVDASNGTTTLAATLGAGTFSAGRVKSGIAWSSAGRSLVANNGTVATDGVPIVNNAITAIGLGANSTGVNPMTGIVERFTIWAGRIADVTLKANTV